MTLENVGSIKIVDYDLKLNFVWSIPDFSKKCQKAGEHIKSSYLEFKDSNLSNVKLQLYIYPYGDATQNECYVSTYLHLFTVEENAKLELKIRFSNNEGSVFKKRRLSYVFSKDHTGRGFPKFIKRDQVLNNEETKLFDDTLVVECYATLQPHPAENSEVNGQAEKLKHDLGVLLEKNMFSDITITVENKVLKAHKSILAARSPVFSAMLDSDMLESRENNIRVTDIEYPVMKELLHYMYCGEVEDLDKFKEPLLRAADKYDVKCLKAMCEKAFRKNISIKNYGEIVKIVQLYGCESLRNDVVNFIVKNPQIFATEEFESIAKTDFNLLKDIMIKQSQLKVS